MSNGSTDSSAVDAVVQHMISSVLRQDWPPGERIPTERDLASMLDVSRATVRSGVALLADWGVLTTRQGSGTTVRPASEWRLPVMPAVVACWFELGHGDQLADLLRDALEVRGALVLDLLGRAAPRAEGRDLDEVRAAAVRAWDAREDPEAFLRLDHQFLISLLDATGLTATMWLLNELRRTYEAVVLAVGAAAPPAQYLKHHLATVDALEAGDAEAARAEFATFLEAITDTLKTVLPSPLVEQL